MKFETKIARWNKRLASLSEKMQKLCNEMEAENDPDLEDDEVPADMDTVWEMSAVYGAVIEATERTIEAHDAFNTLVKRYTK